MAKKQYETRLREFIGEIEQLGIPAFVAPQRWHLHHEIENAVNIGYDFRSPSDRKILHHIARRHGLIALCPNDVVDVDVSDGGTRFFITASCGMLPLKP